MKKQAKGGDNMPETIILRLTWPKPLVDAMDSHVGHRGRSEYLRKLAANDLGKPELAETRRQGRPKEKDANE
jgi:hypothetical protein